MPVTKKQQSEITALMNDYWDSYFRGDMKHWQNYLVDDYRNIGGTEEEIWNSKQEILDYTYRMLDQMVGQSEIRNKQTQIIPYDPYVMVHEFMDLFIKVETEWSFYGKFRLSSLIQEIGNGWKVLHQHGSYPDAHTEQGEAFAFDKLRKENTELRDAVKRRTIELEIKNRDLEIETALERVRARAMGMQKSEELKEVIQIVYEQFIHLNIHVEHAGFIMDYKNRDDMHIWLADKHAIPFEVTIPYFDCAHWNSYNDAKEKGKDFFTNHLSFEEKNKFYSDLFQLVPGVPEETLQYYFSCPGLAISTVLLDNIGLYIENFSGISYTNEENNILMRLGKVFQQTYTRFLDLQLAEEQAREAHIETALERVRARTMAMQKSDELGDVASVLFKELNQLVTNLWTCGFVLCEKDREEDEWWLSMDTGFTRGFFLPHVGDYAHAILYEGWSNGEAFRSVQLDGASLQQHYDWLMDINISRKIFEEMDAAGLERPNWQKLHAAYFSRGYLVLITREPCGEEEIFKRFAQVFDQTYTRFLDLQKAEAQTREAQINLAVERVRAKALAMFKSEEILQVVYKLKEEIMSLHIPGVVAATIHLKEKDDQCRVWDISTVEINEEALHHPMDISYKLETTDPNFFMRRIWGNTDKYFVEMQDEDDLKRTIQWLRDNDRNQQADETEQFIENTKLKKLYHPTIQINNGRMCIDLLESPAPEIESILEKMGAAFDLAYKRFEDLQNAEAQAREAHIVAALEKVRSRSLAMHATNDLGDVVKVIVEKLQELGVVLDANGVILCTYFDQSKDVLHWIVSPDFSMAGSYLLPYFDHPIFNDAWHSKQSGNDYFSKSFSVEEKNSFFEYAFEHSDYKHFPEEFKQWIFQNDKHSLSFAWQKNSAILIPSHTGVLPTEANKAILIRFSKVFEQAYVRFLDLKKAEAQAREAKIEMALEKIRSRTMAMQHSDELPEAANLLFLEVQALRYSCVELRLQCTVRR
jgi:hypothetical protein